MSDVNMPVACRLTASALRERRETVVRQVGQAVLEVKEVEQGYGYRFPADDDLLLAIMHLVRLESKCCPFSRFRITVAAGDGEVWLELTGPRGMQ